MKKDSGILDLGQARQFTSRCQKAGGKGNADSMTGQCEFSHCSRISTMARAPRE